MSATEIENDFPKLPGSGYSVTSPKSNLYNCIAWAARDAQRWWWPDLLDVYYWPSGVQREETLDAVIRVFESLGYSITHSRARRRGFEKIAIYAADPGKAFGFVRKLRGRPERRIRHGPWRALVVADHDEGLLFVIEIGHRREVYR